VAVSANHLVNRRNVATRLLHNLSRRRHRGEALIMKNIKRRRHQLIGGIENLAGAMAVISRHGSIGVA